MMKTRSLPTCWSNLCFASGVVVRLDTSFSGRPVCASRLPCKYANASRVRMEAERVQVVQAQQQLQVWPPPGMTDEWAEAVQRLSNSVKGVTFESADLALEDADGDEELALRNLTKSSVSDIKKQRELAVEQARARGDNKRVDALREAQLRRRATGSAKDFFKGFVDVEGSYVDAGYVDENSDVMGKITNAIQSLFGGRNK